MPINIGSGTGNVTYSNGNFYDSSGNLISGVASYTWAQFTAGDFDTSIARYVHVSDRHSTTDGTSTPGSLWRIDPTATAIRKRNLVSAAIYYGTFATAIAEVPVASWPNHRIYPNDVKAELVNNGTRYAFKQKGLIQLAASTAPDTILTDKNTEKIELQYLFPAGFLAVGDVIWVESHFSKSGTTAANLMARDFHIGTAGTTVDASLMYIGSDLRITTNNLNISCDERKHWQIMSNTVSNATVKRAGPVGSFDYTGFSGVARDSTQTIPSISNALYLSCGYWLSGGTTDTITFEEAAIYLEMRS